MRLFFIHGWIKLKILKVFTCPASMMTGIIANIVSYTEKNISTHKTNVHINKCYFDERQIILFKVNFTCFSYNKKKNADK